MRCSPGTGLKTFHFPLKILARYCQCYRYRRGVTVVKPLASIFSASAPSAPFPEGAANTQAHVELLPRVLRARASKAGIRRVHVALKHLREVEIYRHVPQLALGGAPRSDSEGLREGLALVVELELSEALHLLTRDDIEQITLPLEYCISTSRWFPRISNFLTKSFFGSPVSSLCRM